MFKSCYFIYNSTIIFDFSMTHTAPIPLFRWFAKCSLLFLIVACHNQAYNMNPVPTSQLADTHLHDQAFFCEQVSSDLHFNIEKRTNDNEKFWKAFISIAKDAGLQCRDIRYE